MPTPLRAALLALALGASPLAAAAPSETAPSEAAAEHRRVLEEMNRLAGRNAWKGVEALYLELLALEAQGAALGLEEHLLGAQAASELGRPVVLRERLLKALQVQENEAVRAWLTDLDTRWAPVELDATGGPRELVPAVVPFSPGDRAAIDAARKALEESGRYSGMLPDGRYRFGGTEIEVVGGSQPLVASLVPTAAPAQETGPREDREDRRLRWAGVAMSATGLGLAGLGAWQFGQTNDAYLEYGNRLEAVYNQGLPMEHASGWYQDEVVAGRNRAIVLTAGGALLAVTGAACTFAF